MATVTNTITLPDGSTPTRAVVQIRLVGSSNGSVNGWVTATDEAVVSTVVPNVTNGSWSVDLIPNEDISPSGTAYRVIEYVRGAKYTSYIEVGSGGGTVHDLLVDAPGSAPSPGTEAHNLALTAHSGILQRQTMIYAADYATLQLAADAAASASKPLWIDGAWSISSTLNILCDVYSSSRSVITYTGTGTAVKIGDGTVRSGLHIELPEITKTKTWSAGDLGSSVGLLVDVLYQSFVRFGRIRNFSIGMKLAPSAAAGIVYNTFAGGALWDNAINLQLAPAAGGWVNSNTFQIDRYLASSSTPITGTRHIDLYGVDSSSQINNNTWLQGSVEGNGVEWQLLTKNAAYNLWINLRWESTDGVRINFDEDTSLRFSNNNMVIGGYQLNQATISESTNSRYNAVIAAGTLVMTTSATKIMKLQNGGSSAYGCISLYDSGTSPLTAAETEWRSNLTANWFDLKGKADSQPRLRLSTSGGIIEFGNGSTDPTSSSGTVLPALRNTSGALVWANANLRPGADDALDLGTTSFQVRRGFFSQWVQVGRYTTAGRPSAATAGAGAMIYDTTLSKPIWSDGSVWRDAAGSSV